MRLTRSYKIPFSQANSMKRLINLCELLYNDEMTKKRLQLHTILILATNYYTDAGRYLAL